MNSKSLELDRRTTLQVSAMLALAPIVYPNIKGEHELYHLSRKFFPVVKGTLQVPKIQQPVDCPIYMFHMPSASTVEYIIYQNIRAGKMPITISTLTSILLGDVDAPKVPVFAMTFDDGYSIQLQSASVLRRWNAPATFFVMGTGWPGDHVHEYLTTQQIQDLAEDFEIGSHTVNHPPSLITLRSQNPGAYQGELVDSKIQLENLLQREVRTFAYPTGIYDAEIVADVHSVGYRAAVSTEDVRIQSLALLFSLGRSRR